MLDLESLRLFSEVARKFDNGFRRLPAFQNQSPGMARLAEVLNATAERLQDNYPYFHPLYAGQMLKPPHPVARLAYALAERWRISRPCGWRANCNRERKFSPANKLTIRTGGSAVFCNCHSKACPAMRRAGWT